ncbi:MAG TPA: 50S ribosome-binding GTPase [Methanofastidiosum sp.]|nr:50S ribosome-binding GTPase [Methanofastidiosum sp.]HOR88619.1 50S ribosome-binding GTPase [Methanofastidiosum sp.]HOT85616.1 50S ribosome-binding GTPase [Methanofastidiosum sp.]HPL00342.1 50S ribosome-binding GTPase [Methanofastidiosum sp.]HPU90958.1 50S ribosome-binding GTPase [Methanofastidiosum sp.]
MPVNVTPEYLKAEDAYKSAKNPKEKLIALELMLSTIPKHKGTEKMQLQIKRNLSKLKKEVEKEKELKKGGSGGTSFFVRKEGAAQVALAGLPNSGKSTILNKLTGRDVDIGHYAFTTVKPTPAMLQYKDIQIQLVDMPGLIEGVSLGKGMGGPLISAIRAVDVIVIIVDLSVDPLKDLELILRELEAKGLRINKKVPNIEIQKLPTGGIEIIGENFLVECNSQDVKKVLQEERVHNAIITIKEPVTLTDIFEVLDSSLEYKKAIIVGTKGDLPGSKEGLQKLESNVTNFKIIPVSAINNVNLDILPAEIFSILDIIRVYTRSPGGQIDNEAMPMKINSTALDAAKKVHKNLYKNFKFARVWGESAKFDGQRVGPEHVLRDGDIIEIHI